MVYLTKKEADKLIKAVSKTKSIEIAYIIKKIYAARKSLIKSRKIHQSQSL